MKRASNGVTDRHSRTPVRSLCMAGHTLWVKDDGASHPVYGGNKPRKLEPLLADAARRGCDRLLTFGAVGSHHVLATTLLGVRAGFAVHAVLTPQPESARARRALAAALDAGLEYTPASSYPAAARAALRQRRARDYVIGPGGSGVRSTSAYARAAEELLAQVATGDLPRPDVVVVANGSGGTAAGLALGFGRTGIPVAGIQVAEPAALGAPLAHSYASASGVRAARLPGRLIIEPRYLGRGYGRATLAGQHALALAAQAGLTLELTYTAKAFAAALGLLGVSGAQPPGARLRRLVHQTSAGRPARVLYWHTLSAVEPDPGRTALPQDLAALFLP